MTTEEIESHLAKSYPGHKWEVYERLGIGLPMFDGVMFYTQVTDDLDACAKYVIWQTTATSSRFRI